VYGSRPPVRNGALGRDDSEGVAPVPVQIPSIIFAMMSRWISEVPPKIV
jgi:hypothetical protein